MASNYMTPGVYIEVQNALPSTVVAVASAIPVFIGYTEFAHGPNGQDLTLKPTRISSLAEYFEYFGGAFKPVFNVNLQAAAQADAQGVAHAVATTTVALSFAVNADFSFIHPTTGIVSANVSFKPATIFLMYNALRLFFMNGGSDCYILPIKTYGGTQGFANNKSDYFSEDGSMNVFTILKAETEPTLIVMPDVVTEGTSCYDSYYKQVLLHCADTQSRFGIFDVCQSAVDRYNADDVDSFRFGIGTTALNYGAAYFPWLNTLLVQESDVDFENIDSYDTVIKQLPEFAGVDGTTTTLASSTVATTTSAATTTSVAGAANVAAASTVNAAPPTLASSVFTSLVNYKASSAGMSQATRDAARLTIHQAVREISPTYKLLVGNIVRIMNIMPPSGAMAGIYALTDGSAGVWKAPANVSVAGVSTPTIDILFDMQKQLNDDAMSGKSINVIKPFPSIGTVVWGARTLDGNSEDWRYVNVRRTLIMIEQSLKLSARAFVFEPNDSNTWITIKAMFNNFLNGLWAQGALVGAVPEQAYNVQVGIGVTMTPNDILDGIMRISVKLAIVHPAEFIVLTFQQQQRQS